jgi:hypothetical protein
MRTFHALAVTAVAACSVPEKQALDAAPPIDAPDAPVDDSAPDTMLVETPPEFANQGTATFRFTSDDPTATFVCSVDGETPQPCTSPVTRSLGDGPHAFSVRAVDPTGNADDTPAEHLWTIDTVAPDTTITMGPPPNDNSVQVKFTFASSETNATFECAIDTSSYSPCTSGASIGPFGDGQHVFSVRARDRAGNVDASPSIRAWTIDTSTPDTQLVSGPSGAVATRTATFTFVSPDAGAGATFECNLDGTGFTACTSPRTYTNLTERAHTFAVRVRDAVGNSDPTPATAAWTVDLTPPETVINTGPTGVVAMASAAFTFSSNELGVAFACSLDGAPFAPCTSPFTTAALAQGAHAFAVRATDPAGHADASPATRSWTIDPVAPDVSITAAPGATSGPRVTFAFAVSDGAPQCSLDAAPFAPCTSPIAFNLPAGAHQFRVRAVDAAGNIGMETRAWTVVCSAPDTLGAAGLLHLDDTDQTLANAVAGGAAATLGDTALVEPGDPASAAGRFGAGLAFTAAESDHVAWPLALAAQPVVTLELWARPDAPAGGRHVATSADGRVDLVVTAASPSTVRFSITVIERMMPMKATTVTSAPVAAAAWHHVLVSAADPTLRLWVDGVRSDAPLSVDDPLALDAIRLGGNGPSAYSGGIDEVWIAQTAIATDEAALARYCPL